MDVTTERLNETRQHAVDMQNAVKKCADKVVSLPIWVGDTVNHSMMIGNVRIHMVAECLDGTHVSKGLHDKLDLQDRSR